MVSALHSKLHHIKKGWQVRIILAKAKKAKEITNMDVNDKLVI